eukprot:CAMPEP_0206505500 /NCGR_PEP_ID=MMETSP0324_2-20121206/56174_1 /ASSEMBLY_ACC=CAM_ASM_000836 /TAXON_ID=2866 /ORGANISM="Crypthecodinium cohnii, Strain Seligo" /LENGTH=49 /DNA_ID= /DNA_START= /DNA_END= /DNA_ORIENTATION=
MVAAVQSSIEEQRNAAKLREDLISSIVISKGEEDMRNTKEKSLECSVLT